MMDVHGCQRLATVLGVFALSVGCAQTPVRTAAKSAEVRPPVVATLRLPEQDETLPSDGMAGSSADTTKSDASAGSFELTAFQSDAESGSEVTAIATSPEQISTSQEQISPSPVPESVDPVTLDEVVLSVISNYPLLQSALYGRNIARGEYLQSMGEFDLKLKADTLNNPLGNYENYRSAVYGEQPLFSGGSVFGGYRVGRGDFPVYYGERETEPGGEFKAGAAIPLAQNRTIDDRRTGVWRNSLEIQAVEPDIQAQLISFVQAGSVNYWTWVASGYNVRIARNLLANATERDEGLARRVEEGDAPAIELTDNQRLIVSRQTKLIDAERKLQQSAYKLSLFLRDDAGQPLVMDESRLPPDFPEEQDPSLRDLRADIERAVSNRPELRALSLLERQLRIDLQNARNLCLPQVDAVAIGSQDVGGPVSAKKDDKGEFDLEAGFIASVPLQRRKARGKVMAVEGKLAQVRAKSRFTQDKIVAEVQSASVALHAAWQQLGQARQSLELAKQMEAAERRKFDLGESNLLLVNLREQQTADAAAVEVESQLNFFSAEADFRAAIGEAALASDSPDP